MYELMELQDRATKLVHWPTGVTYACDYHAGALQKIASSMRIHVAVRDCIDSQRQCTNCLNENSIARFDAEA